MNKHEFCCYIRRLATKALLYEVSVTPKPGLVDRYNSGAHRDMDFFTFLNSSLSLSDYFYICAEQGINFNGDNYSDLLKSMRSIGIKAEKDMFNATEGVNTHRGLIFSIGIISVSTGLHFKKYGKEYISASEISDIVKLLAEDITVELNCINPNKNLTYGERLYLQYGVKGIRGEAEAGFETVLVHSLPVLKSLLKEEKHINDILVNILLHLIVNTEDSNILGRHNSKILDYAKEKAENALKHGGYFTTEGRLLVEEMDRCFIEKNISPGGSADLIAVTLMLYFIENGDNIKYNIGAR